MNQLLVLSLLLATAMALTTPLYLGRDPDKKCLDSYDEGTASFVCTPEEMPDECHDEKVFKAHQDDQDMPKCKDKKHLTGTSGVASLSTGVTVMLVPLMRMLV